MKELVWTFEGGVRAKTHPTIYRLLENYKPVRIWCHLDELPGDNWCIVDIKDDGTSILSSNLPTLDNAETTRYVGETEVVETILVESQITCSIQENGTPYYGRDLVVILYLEEA